jgi:predicted Fe-Mo cluster-binding NifX family protein
MSNVKPNKNTALATDQKAIQGVGKHFAKVKTLTLAGASYTPASLKALFQAEIEANNALDASRAQMKEQVATTRATRAKATVARKGLRAYILGNYGASAVAMLEDFGMSPPKAPGPKTVTAKAEAVVTATATREANGPGKKKPAAVAPSTAAQANPPAHVAQATAPVQTAAPAAINAPQS